MKGYKKLVPIALILCMFGSFYMLYSARAEKANIYKNYLKNARTCAEQGITIDAVKNYAEALAIKDTLEIRLEVGEFYLKMKDTASAVGWGEQMKDTYPNEAEGYEFLFDIYKKSADYNRCYALAEEATKRGVQSKKISEEMKKIEYVYYLTTEFEEVGVYSNGLCAVKSNGKWGFVNEVGRKTVPYRFETVGSFSNEMAPVKTFEGEYYFIDNAGNKKMVVKNVKNITELGSISSNVFPVKNGEVWNFYTIESKKLKDSYDAVSIMGNQIAAVEKENKWTLINQEGKKVTDTKYSDVIQDEKGVVYRNGVLFVNMDGSYYLIDKDGKKISKEKYEDAKLFIDDTYAAVKQNKKWHFIDAKGKNVFPKLSFEDARSFSNGYAAVKQNGRWGFIDLKGNLVIEDTFEDAKDFNGNGCVFVKQENIWQLLKLYSKNYEK